MQGRQGVAAVRPTPLVHTMLKIMAPLSQETYGSEWCPAMDAVSTHSDSPSSRSGRITQVRLRFCIQNPITISFSCKLLFPRLISACLQAVCRPTKPSS